MQVPERRKTQRFLCIGKCKQQQFGKGQSAVGRDEGRDYTNGPEIRVITFQSSAGLFFFLFCGLVDKTRLNFASRRCAQKKHDKVDDPLLLIHRLADISSSLVLTRDAVEKWPPQSNPFAFKSSRKVKSANCT